MVKLVLCQIICATVCVNLQSRHRGGCWREGSEVKSNPQFALGEGTL